MERSPWLPADIHNAGDAGPRALIGRLEVLQLDPDRADLALPVVGHGQVVAVGREALSELRGQGEPPGGGVEEDPGGA